MILMIWCGGLLLASGLFFPFFLALFFSSLCVGYRDPPVSLLAGTAFLAGRAFIKSFFMERKGINERERERECYIRERAMKTDGSDSIVSCSSLFFITDERIEVGDGWPDTIKRQIN